MKNMECLKCGHEFEGWVGDTCPKCKGDKTMTINKIKINTMETRPTTKFKAILGLIALFVGGCLVRGVTCGVTCGVTWLDMTIRHVIR